MGDIVKCKKCQGKGEHRRGEKCATCKGSGKVKIVVDAEGNKTITPAVRS